MASHNSIVHIDLDTFFVSCERLQDRRLHGKPILIGGTSDRGVVASCSYEARLFGIHSAMPMKMARQLCPEAIVMRGDSTTYSKYSAMVTEIIRESVPLYEKSSIDEFYLDLTGLDQYFGTMQYASALRKRIIHETGLPLSFGLSSNKTVSKIATGEAKPNNEIKIDPGKEKQFLSPLSVRKIPMVGAKTYQSLRSLGIKSIKNLQEIPVDLLENIFGKSGRILWKKAQGIDDSPVIPYHERKSISTERTFDKDTIDVIKLRGILVAMVETLTYQLRNNHKLTACVAVKIRYSDFKTYSSQKQISYTSADHVLIPTILHLFDKLYNRRIRVRLIGVRFSHLVDGGHQIHLFEDTIEQIRLYEAMDHIRRKFGDRSVIRASGMDAKSIGHIMNPFTGEPPTLLPNRRQ